jgi:sugar phosphate permease
MLSASCAAQIAAQRGIRPAQAQPVGLVLLVAGLAALVLASPLGSLFLLFVGAALAGTGHGMGVLYAQDELNQIAPAERRGEVTAAFITVIYLANAVAVIGTGLLDLRFSLDVSVASVAVVIAAVALATAAWHERAVVASRRA